MSNTTPHVLVTSVQVPFTRGGAEILVDGLVRELNRRGFKADVLDLPTATKPKVGILENLALWKALDVREFHGRKIDLVIGTKWPSYCLDHPNKVVWLVHQLRQMYELYGGRFSDFDDSVESEALRRTLVKLDKEALEQCVSRYTISHNVTARLKRYLGLDSSVLHPPLPLGEKYHSGEKGNYILSVGRLCMIKRVDMLIKALPQIDPSIALKVVGVADEVGVEDYLNSEIDKHHLWNRVEFLGRVSEDDLVNLYANAFAVYYAPFDEDYGFVTLEGLASGKPVITASDSGGVLSFIRHEVNGLVAEPTESSLADTCNRLVREPGLYEKLTITSREEKLTHTWDEVISSLTSSLTDSGDAALKRTSSERARAVGC